MKNQRNIDMKRSKTERRIQVLTATLEELEKEYTQAFDELLADDTTENQNKERRLFQRINEVKKELDAMKANSLMSDEELEAMITGVEAEKVEISESENKMLDAIADNF